MIDHLTVSVADLALAEAFYGKVLATLGYGLVMSYEGGRGYGPPGKPVLWLKQADPPSRPMHLAFRAPDRPAVAAFHVAALAAGARDDGAPGLRAHYHPSYFAAFVIDPFGHPVEAVCHLPPARARKARPAPRKAAARAPARRKAPKRKARR